MTDMAGAGLIRQVPSGGHRDGAAARVGSPSKFLRKKGLLDIETVGCIETVIALLMMKMRPPVAVCCHV